MRKDAGSTRVLGDGTTYKVMQNGAWKRITPKKGEALDDRGFLKKVRK